MARPAPAVLGDRAVPPWQNRDSVPQGRPVQLPLPEVAKRGCEFAAMLTGVAAPSQLQPLGDPSSRFQSGIFEKRDYLIRRGHKRALSPRGIK